MMGRAVDQVQAGFAATCPSGIMHPKGGKQQQQQQHDFLTTAQSTAFYGARP
jgi:hypothetical protein